MWGERGRQQRVCVCVRKRRESDTEGYCCISSLSSCLASENRRRRVMSGLLSSTSLSLHSYCSISLFFFLSLSSTVTLPRSTTAFPLSSVLIPILPSFPLSLLLFIGLFMQRSDVQQLRSKLGNELCMPMNVSCVCVYNTQPNCVFMGFLCVRYTCCSVCLQCLIL